MSQYSGDIFCQSQLIEITAIIKINPQGYRHYATRSMDGMYFALYTYDFANYHPSTPKDEF